VHADAAGKPYGARVFCFGSGQYNQLGLGDGMNRDIPTELSSLEESISGVSAGLHNSAAVTDGGALYTWGRGQRLVLGHGDRSEIPYPRQVDALSDVHVVQVSLNEFAAAALDKDGAVYTWGSRALGREGKGEYPEKVTSLEGIPISKIACGSSHTIAIAQDGKLYAWGSGYEGALGLDESVDRKEPTVVPGIDAKHVACGKAFTLVINKEGKLISFGAGDYGQTGHGGGPSSERYTRKPKIIKTLEKHTILHADAGVYHSACVTDEGRVFTWGYGKDGQCGHGDRAVHSPLPRQVASLKNKRAIKVSCGDGHTAVLCEGGQLYVFGRGRDGQLGRGDHLESVASYRTEPMCVDFFASGSLHVKAVTLGGYHSVVLASSK